jgi:hypothetical protein
LPGWSVETVMTAWVAVGSMRDIVVVAHAGTVNRRIESLIAQ